MGCATIYSLFCPGRYRGHRHRPVLLRLQKLLFGKRSLAVLVMTLLLFLLFVIPIALLVNSPVDNSAPLIKNRQHRPGNAAGFRPAELDSADRR